MKKNFITLSLLIALWAYNSSGGGSTDTKNSPANFSAVNTANIENTVTSIRDVVSLSYTGQESSTAEGN